MPEQKWSLENAERLYKEHVAAQAAANGEAPAPEPTAGHKDSQSPAPDYEQSEWRPPGDHPVYLIKGVVDELTELAATSGGNRDIKLFISAKALGQFVDVDRKWLREKLFEACEINGLTPEDGIRQTRVSIGSGFKAADEEIAKAGPRDPNGPSKPKVTVVGAGAFNTKSGDPVASKSNAGGKAKRTIDWSTAMDVADGIPTWAWEYGGKGRLARATLVLFAGRPDAGKSTAARYFAGGYTLGTLEGCFWGQPQNVAYIASEESIKYVVKPTLRAASADLSRVYFPTVKMDGKQVRLLSTLDEAALIVDLKDRDITVVFVDPVMSSIGSGVDIHRTNEVREHIEPWARIAEAIDGLVIGIVHLNKAPGFDIVAAINSSSAFGEVARAVIAFTKDPQSKNDERVLSQEKNNAGVEDLALTYTIESTTVQTDEGPADVARFVIGGPSDRRVADVIHAEKTVARLAPRTLEVIEAHRAAGKPLSAADVSNVVARLTRDDAGKYQRRLAGLGLLDKAARGLYEYPRFPEKIPNK